MKRLHYLALLILSVSLAMAGCEKGPGPNRLPALDDDAVILAFGDSITHGTGASNGQSYPSQLSDRIGRRVVNAGVPGEKTAGGLQRLPAVVSKTTPDLVILCLGGNDFLKRVDAATTQKNLAAMLEWLKAQEIPVVLMAVPQLGLGLGGNLSPADVYAELGEEFEIVVEDQVISDVLSQRDLKADPIHPNAKGYARIAEALESLLRKNGALPR